MQSQTLVYHALVRSRLAPGMLYILSVPRQYVGCGYLVTTWEIQSILSIKTMLTERATGIFRIPGKVDPHQKRKNFTLLRFVIAYMIPVT